MCAARLLLPAEVPAIAGRYPCTVSNGKPEVPADIELYLARLSASAGRWGRAVDLTGADPEAGGQYLHRAAARAAARLTLKVEERTGDAPGTAEQVKARLIARSQRLVMKSRCRSSGTWPALRFPSARATALAVHAPLPPGYLPPDAIAAQARSVTVWVGLRLIRPSMPNPRIRTGTRDSVGVPNSACVSTPGRPTPRRRWQLVLWPVPPSTGGSVGPGGSSALPTEFPVGTGCKAGRGRICS